MVKVTLQRLGLRKVCKNCGETDHKLVGADLVCIHCGKKEFVEMGFIERKQFLRELANRQRLRKFSFYHCDELHAGLFILLVVICLFFFTWMIHSKWGLW